MTEQDTALTARGPSSQTLPSSLFFTIPPELRIQILELALNPPEEGIPLDRPGQKSAIFIFLVCKQMYADAAAVYYQGAHIELRGWGSWSPPQQCVQRFLRQATVPRQLVRDLTVCLKMVDCCNCRSLADLELAKHLELRRLTVLIGPDYPYPPFGCSVHPPSQPRHFFQSYLGSGEQVTGPICLGEKPWQTFLEFLQRPEFGKVTVKVNRFHLGFLCQFHEPDEGRECRGEWRGVTDWIPLDHKAMVAALGGVAIDGSVAPERGCVSYKPRIDSLVT